MKSVGTFGTLRRFAATLIKIAPRRVAQSALVMIGMSATEGIGLLLLVPLLQLVGVNAGTGGALNRLTNALSSAFLAVGIRPTLGSILLVYLGAVYLQSVLARREAVLRHLLEQDIMREMRLRLYRAISGAKWVYFIRERGSSYTQLLTDEIWRIGSLTYLVVDLVVVSLMTVLYSAMAFRVSPSMTLVVLVVGVLFLPVMRSRMRDGRKAGQHHSASSKSLHAAIADHLASMKIARSYGTEQRHGAIFQQLSEELTHVGTEALHANGRLRQQLAVGSAAVLAVIVYVSYSMLGMSAAQLLLLLFLFARVVPRLASLYEKAQTIATVAPSFEVVLAAEQRCLAAAEIPDAPSGATRPVTPAVPMTRGITLDEVVFDYRGDGDVFALRGVDLQIPAGKTTAVVGPSGSGKSTLADLLIGLLEPTSGQILVDGEPLTHTRLPAWRSMIGYVSQETFLFHDSVRANLLWARPDATEEEMWTALRLAAADAFVSVLPSGLDTVLGDRGILVSGGERQRLSLARALLRRPALLILDEATSSLDSENEARIQDAIDHLHQQMTIVIITHRLSTIRGADLIHVLDRGKLIESGTWSALTGRPGRFRELCQAQGVEDLLAK